MAPFFTGGNTSDIANGSSPSIRAIWRPTANGDEAGLSRIAQAYARSFDTLHGGRNIHPMRA